jgi:outer membrane protein OmpA-like peptidoglycan-associated protein
MKALLFLLPLVLAAPAAAREKDPWIEPWAGARYTNDDIKASHELKDIQEKIDRRELPKIQFDFDSDKIRLESYSTLTLIADLLLKHTNLKVRITAHTCTIGSYEYNMKLSERRAKSVKTFLAKQGVPPPSIRYKGLGYTQPIADNSTEEGREKNRRVEFSIVTREWGSVY